VLRLSEDRGNVAFLLRSESGELFGVYRRNAQEALSAAPLSWPYRRPIRFRVLISLRQKAAVSRCAA